MIQADELKFTYPGNAEPTLKGLNFCISPGEIFGFLGPSGAGKSTTQNILIGLLKNYSGSVKVMGKELVNISGRFYENIGVAFEFPNLYNKFTALENLNFFRSLYSEATAEPSKLLAMVGLEKELHTRVSAFSKGMKMRLNFCRAFLNHPQVVFLDEPTAGLDPANAKRIKNIIFEQKKAGVTVFLTTHDMHVAEDLCDRVAFIVDGQLRLIDSPRELKLKYGRKMVRIEYRQNGKIQRIEYDLENLAANKNFFHIIQSGQIETMHTLEANLDDIFIQTTGRDLI
ncbi:ABC transporter ATP-binding protein [candidate division KSB1 bacterium]|nr:ABC transporter ATP-binding protein [candidate division KSB1 bacterium]